MEQRAISASGVLIENMKKSDITIRSTVLIIDVSCSERNIFTVSTSEVQR